MRGSHSFKTTARIRETTQVMIGVHTWHGALHVHPIKVWQRHSPTMFLPHVQRGEDFLPISGSFEATELLSSISRRGAESGRRQLDYWIGSFSRPRPDRCRQSAGGNGADGRPVVPVDDRP